MASATDGLGSGLRAAPPARPRRGWRRRMDSGARCARLSAARLRRGRRRLMDSGARSASPHCQGKLNLKLNLGHRT